MSLLVLMAAPKARDLRNEIQVILPYCTLEQLLNAAGETRQLRSEVRRLTDQVSALRLMLVELLEKLE